MNELLERRCVNIEKDQYAGVEKQLLRDELEKLTAEFEARGGKVSEIPSSQYMHGSRLGTTINLDREVERADRMALLPVSLREPRIESGCKGVIRDGIYWTARWRNAKIGKFGTINDAIEGLLQYLQSIGYKPD